MPQATRILYRCAALAVALLLPLVGFAANEKVTGAFAATGGEGGYVSATFTCFGLPTCTGLYAGVAQDSGCSNTLELSDGFTITGLDLSQPGPLSGTLIIARDWSSPAPPAGGTIVCNYTMRDRPVSIPYTGTWDGSQGIISFTGADPGGGSGTVILFGAFTATVSNTPPVFPLQVTGSITPTVSNIQATFQPRPQDIGTRASTFVFALAPASALKNAVVTKETHFGLMTRLTAKDAPVACVLAQLNSSGQLSAVSASSMQALTTGVLSAQGQSVTILNNIATPNVAGATFFVGYGADAGTMINSGVNRSAITVPGTMTCNPQPPQTGWWWNPLEGGRGFSIEAQGNHLFFAAFHYDVSGRATWNVSPGTTSLEGSYFTSDLYNVTGGQTLGGSFPGVPPSTKVGPITLAFSDASHGTMTWPGGTVPIERQNLVTGGLAAPPQANVPESGWWWNPQEGGRGFFIEWQKGWADLAGYMYDDRGNPVWYISVFETPNPRSFNGAWWTFANGQSMGGAYKAPTQTSNNVAPVTITFSAPDTATMTLPNGRTTNLVRQRF